MSERSEGTVWNDEIEIGKWRKIAARGLTPNYIHHKITAGDIHGKLLAFEHFTEGTTVVTIQVIHREGGRLSREFAEVDLAHLDEIEIEA